MAKYELLNSCSEGFLVIELSMSNVFRLSLLWNGSGETYHKVTKKKVKVEMIRGVTWKIKNLIGDVLKKAVINWVIWKV